MILNLNNTNIHTCPRKMVGGTTWKLMEGDLDVRVDGGLPRSWARVTN